MTLEWKGDQVKAKLDAAQIFGINKTLELVVTHAKNNHTWQYRAGTLEGAISTISKAFRTSKGFRGEWGTKDVKYALIHELGGKIVPKQAKALKFQVGGKWVKS